MAEKKQKRKRGREYLNDFQMNVAGEYIYTGRHYRWVNDRKTALIRLWLFAAAGTAAALIGGCIPGTGMEGAAWVLLPYVISLICVFSCIYAVLRLTNGGDPLREYVYVATIEKLPIRCMMTAIFSSLSILGEIGNLIFADFAGSIPFAVLLIALEGAVLAVSVLLRRTVMRLEWTLA